MSSARQPRRLCPDPTRHTTAHLAPLAGLALCLLIATGALAPTLAFKPPVSSGTPATPAPAAEPAPKKKRAVPAKPAGQTKGSSASQSIVALVNDEPITGYEVEQRVQLAMLGAPELQRRLQRKLKASNIDAQFKAFALKRLKADPPKSEAEQQARVKQLQAQFVQSIKRQVEAEFLPAARKKALEELIDERLKMQEAKRLTAIAGDDEVDRIIKGMAEQNKMTPDEFAQHLRKAGGDIKEMRLRIKASLSWAAVIRRRFGHQIALAGGQMGRVIAAVGTADDVQLRVQRILLALPSDVAQTRVAQRLSEAERLRSRFSDCGSMNNLASGVGGARFDDMGERRPSTIDEPTRSLLLSAQDGEMLPPTIGEGGVELWAVCGRKALKVEGAEGAGNGDELRQKEFEILSKKHMKDLRQDAHIEYR